MIDDNLAKASTPLFNALYDAAAGIGPLDEKINGMLSPAATTLSSEMARRLGLSYSRRLRYSINLKMM